VILKIGGWSPDIKCTASEEDDASKYSLNYQLVIPLRITVNVASKNLNKGVALFVSTHCSTTFSTRAVRRVESVIASFASRAILDGETRDCRAGGLYWNIMMRAQFHDECMYVSVR